VSPLPNYGVAIGTLVSFTRDPQHDFGHWYHGHVTLDAAGTQWASALDVDAPSSVGVAYRLVTDLTIADLGPVAQLAEGWHPLTHDASSGALDYIREHALQDGFVVRWLRRAFIARQRQGLGSWSPAPANLGLPGGPDPGDVPLPSPPFPPTPIDGYLKWLLRWRLRFPLKWLGLIPFIRWRSFPWVDSTGDNALDALGPHLQAASRICIFGEHYEDGTNGVHDVHMNQGDPPGTQWYLTDDGIWQDGGVACQKPDGSVVIWQVRFKTQSLHTDDQGHPV
jgi:Uncharacterized conserved protein (DUF2278)